VAELGGGVQDEADEAIDHAGGCFRFFAATEN
jgi:hypothetical protein